MPTKPRRGVAPGGDGFDSVRDGRNTRLHSEGTGNVTERRRRWSLSGIRPGGVHALFSTFAMQPDGTGRRIGSFRLAADRPVPWGVTAESSLERTRRARKAPGGFRDENRARSGSLSPRKSDIRFSPEFSSDPRRVPDGHSEPSLCRECGDSAMCVVGYLPPLNEPWRIQRERAPSLPRWRLRVPSKAPLQPLRL